jgi:hypothetical protein
MLDANLQVNWIDTPYSEGGLKYDSRFVIPAKDQWLHAM